MTQRLIHTILAAAVAALPVLAQGHGPKSMIVVFKEGVNLTGYAQGLGRPVSVPPGFEHVDKNVAAAVNGLEQRHNFHATDVYSHALRGFAAALNDQQVKDLRNNSLVDYIEEDGIVTAIGKQTAASQTLPWGINRINADTSSTYAGNGSGTVSGVNVYVIDTGIDITHPDLNVVQFLNYAKDGRNTDCNGHGTHVAGTIAAKDNTSYVVGAAPGAPLTAVKVLGCSGSGSTSGVIAGVDWVTANAVKPAVANMSLGGSVSQALDDAVKRSAAAGVLYAIAAGNDGVDACNSSPARVGGGTNNGIMTVAATDSSDKEASFSNFGACVDIWAPGVSILSTYKGSGMATMSGTSMATPHVAGTAALLQSTSNLSPAQAENSLKNTAFTSANKSKDGATIKIVNAGAY